MLNQILLTLLVVVVVIFVTRAGRRSRVAAREAPREQKASAHARPSWMPSTPALLGYGLLLVMIIAAAGVYYVRWQDASQVVRVRVLDGRSGEVTEYQVRKSEINGRTFRTIDGRHVSLGDGDRMERIDR